MSYPWWNFHVEFEDGAEIDYIATGLTQSDALRELLDVTYGPSAEDDFSKAVQAHGEPKVIELRGIVEPVRPTEWREKIVEVNGETGL